MKSTVVDKIDLMIGEQSEYQKFFKKKLKEAGKPIAKMSKEEKKKFFDDIEKSWTKEKNGD